MGVLVGAAERSGLRVTASATLAALVLMLGNGFRDRPTDVEPALDWLVLGQLGLALVGMVTGALLLRRSVREGPGPGLMLLVCYGTLLALTALPSPWAKTALGYTFLWFGGLVLCAGLVYSSSTRKELDALQQVLFWSLTVTVLATAAVAWARFDPSDPAAAAYSAVPRLGQTAGTHPSNLAYYTSFAFCLSYWPSRPLHRTVAWVLRAAFVVIILATGTRVPLLICGAAALYALVHGAPGRGQWLTLFVLGVCTLAAAGLIMAMRLPGSDFLTGVITRGDPSDIHTLTSRTDIWRAAIGELEAQPYRALVGFGYGASRFAFLAHAPLFPFTVHHTHNDLLEGVYSAGALTIPVWLAIAGYALAWPLANRALSAALGDATAVHGVAVTAGFLLTAALGPVLSAKLAPPLLVLMVFLLTLDLRRQPLRRTREWQ